MGRFMTPTEAAYALEKAGKLHAGLVKLPPEVKQTEELITSKIRNAELFTARLRAVDEGMINEIVQLKVHLDAMYAKWGLE